MMECFPFTTTSPTTLTAPTAELVSASGIAPCKVPTSCSTFPSKYTLNGAPIRASSVECVDQKPILFRQFLQHSLGADPGALFGICLDQGHWMDPTMSSRGEPLNRSKFFMFEDVQGDGSLIPKYSYPGFQYGAMEHYQPMTTIHELDHLSTALKQSLQNESKPLQFNHLIGTKYCNIKDAITWHSEKTKDIRPGSVIVMLSLGAVREFQIRNVATGTATAFQLHPGDLVLMDWEFTQSHQHRLAKGGKEELTGLHHEESSKPHVSLMFRDINTMVKLSDIQKRAHQTEKNREARKRMREQEHSDGPSGELPTSTSSSPPKKRTESSNDDDEEGDGILPSMELSGECSAAQHL